MKQTKRQTLPSRRRRTLRRLLIAAAALFFCAKAILTYLNDPNKVIK